MSFDSLQLGFSNEVTSPFLTRSSIMFQISNENKDKEFTTYANIKEDYESPRFTNLAAKRSTRLILYSSSGSLEAYHTRKFH